LVENAKIEKLIKRRPPAMRLKSTQTKR